MRVPIPTIFTPRVPSHAPLTTSFIPYMEERTEWLQRFCHLSVHLEIPHICVVPMTVSHTCMLALTIHASSSQPEGDLLEGRRPLEIDIKIPDGASELLEESIKTTMCHATLIDATCKRVKVEIFAKFVLHEVPSQEYDCVEYSDNGFIEILS